MAVVYLGVILGWLFLLRFRHGYQMEGEYCLGPQIIYKEDKEHCR